MTGAGRRSPGELIAQIRPIDVRNGDFDVAGTPKQIGATLNSYALYSVNDQFLVPAGEAQVHYGEFLLSIQQLSGTDTNGNAVNWSGQFQAGSLYPNGFIPSDVMLHRGRDTVLQFNLSDATIPTANLNGPVFNKDVFDQENLDPSSGNLVSVFSDYVAFDVTGLAAADRPNLVFGGVPAADADMILFSGDAISLSAGIDAQDTFQVISPNVDPNTNMDHGQINSPTDVGGVISDGTYTLFEPDWRLIDPSQGIIVSLQGRWRPYTQVLSGIGSYMMLVFPNSRDDQAEFKAVYISRDGAGNITQLWYGPARFTGPNANEIRLTRVRDALSAIEIDPAVGTLSSYVMANGEITAGTFTFPAGMPADFAFPLTGSFRVFRK